LRKVDGRHPGSGMANVSAYVPSLKKLFYWQTSQPNDAWFYDPQTNVWSHVKVHPINAYRVSWRPKILSFKNA
jgi:hypothetical protein